MPICILWYFIISSVFFCAKFHARATLIFVFKFFFSHLCLSAAIGLLCPITLIKFLPLSTHYQAHTFLMHNICGIKSCNEFSSSNYPFYCGVCVCVCSVAKLCLTLCNPMGCNPPGSCVYGIFQAKILEWCTISFSRKLPDPETEPVSPALAGRFFTTEPPGKLLLW